MSKQLPVIFVGHGAGPMFLLEGRDELFKAGDKNSLAVKEMSQEWGRLFSKEYEQPRAIVIVSAHWESSVPGQVEVLGYAKETKLLFDYYGFPPAAYEVEYKCPMDPEANEVVKSALKSAGIKVTETDHRKRGGFDHGVFIPLKVLYPPADIPVVQVSLDTSLDPAAHIKLGKALGSLREQGMLIIGSGMTVHNMRGMGMSSKTWATEFQKWIDNIFAGPNHDKALEAALNWEKAPHARTAHPREEHLLPFFVADAAGLGATAKRRFLSWMGDAFPLNVYVWE